MEKKHDIGKVNTDVFKLLNETKENIKKANTEFPRKEITYEVVIWHALQELQKTGAFEL